MKYGDFYYVDSLFIMIREDEVVVGDFLECLFVIGLVLDKGLEILLWKKVLIIVVCCLSEVLLSIVFLFCDCCIVLF